MVDMNISTRGRTCVGRWYPKPDRYVIFVNKIAEAYDPEDDFEQFMADFLATEFHELGHIFGWRGGCKKRNTCSHGMCYWCEYTHFTYMWFLYNFNEVEWDCKNYKLWLKDKIKEIKEHNKLWGIK